MTLVTLLERQCNRARDEVLEILTPAVTSARVVLRARGRAVEPGTIVGVIEPVFRVDIHELTGLCVLKESRAPSQITINSDVAQVRAGVLRFFTLVMLIAIVLSLG